MARFRKKPVEIEASQWFKPGDHPAVRPRPAEIQFGQNRRFYYVDSADPLCRPTSWFPVDDPEAFDAQALPFATHDVRSGDRAPLADYPELARVYRQAHGWQQDPRDFGLIGLGFDVRVVAPGDWVITEADGTQHPCKPDVFSATYDKVT